MSELQHVNAIQEVPPELLAIGDVARLCDCSRDAADYAVRVAGIRPLGIVGGVRAFKPDDVARVRLELKRISHKSRRELSCCTEP